MIDRGGKKATYIEYCNAIPLKSEAPATDSKQKKSDVEG